MGTHDFAPTKWTWLKILAVGGVLYAALERAAVATNDINYIPALLVVGAVTVPLAFVSFLYARIRMDLPVGFWALLLACALYGGVIGSITAGYLEYDAIKELGTLPTLLIGVIEESAKLLVPLFFLLRYRKTFRAVHEAVVLGAAAGAGFAVLESMGYGLTALIASQGNITAAVDTLLVRGALSPAAHIAWTGLAAGGVWVLIHRAGKRPVRHFLMVFAGVVLLHACWDGLNIPLVLPLLSAISLTWLLLTVRRSKTATHYTK